MPLSWIYGKIADARNALYDKGIFQSFDLGARTISIGNITTGGTGKTPLTAYVAEILAARGERVCILTRGYGRKNPKQRVLVSDGETILAGPLEAGDEPFELAQRLLGKAIVLADANRVAAAEWAKRKFDASVFILDDGFQHRRAKRDVDIVCIDATDPFGGRKMLPSGRLREPLRNLKRAEIVVITHADLAGDISDLKFQISELDAEALMFSATNEITRVVGLEEFNAKTQSPQRDDTLDLSERAGARSEPALAFCGIGNPASFFEQLRRENFSVTATDAFRDHHVYTQQDIAGIENKVRESGTSVLFTTAKDAVKLSNLRFEMPCFVVEIRLVIDDPDSFAAKL
jgi:tetraacyldisaccharide 4'-kinase